MNFIKPIAIISAIFLFACQSTSNNTNLITSKGFNMEQDLMLLPYDCKTDVDDLQSIAGFATLQAHPNYSDIRYHAIAGAYGIQEGLYVPPNALFQLSFGNNWTDAHKDFDAAVEKVQKMAVATLQSHGNIWIAEAGQSDFSAALVKAIQAEMPSINTKERIHIVQHANWNEEVTAPENLQFVKQHTDYHKIPSGNALDNGTPGFNTKTFKTWREKVTEPQIVEIWQLAIDLCNQYNGKENRYLNEAISAGGLDFSDFAEVCWILDLEDIRDAEQFLDLYAKQN